MEREASEKTLMIVMEYANGTLQHRTVDSYARRNFKRLLDVEKGAFGRGRTSATIFANLPRFAIRPFAQCQPHIRFPREETELIDLAQRYQDFQYLGV